MFDSDVSESEMININSVKKDNGNIVVGVKGQEKFIHLPFNKKDKYFMNPIDFLKFIKATEQSIRQSREYSRYIAYLKNEVGLRTCAVFPDLRDVPIEMHHFIFTLFDIVEIQISYLFKIGDRINSANVAHNVLKDHFDNIICIIPLCEAAHKAVHASMSSGSKIGDFFVSIDGAWGDLNAFVKKYSDSMTINHYMKLKKYFEEYDKRKNDKNKVPEVFKESVTKWADEFNFDAALEATEEKRRIN